MSKVTIYPGVAHNAWDYAFKTDNSLHTPNVYEWLMSHTNTVNNGNKIPVANAGSDQTMYLPTSSASLTGSGVDSDGSIASYSWTKISGPSATLTNATTSKLTLSNLQEGTYIFRLTVKDNSGNTDSDYIKMSVVSNIVPVANAGADKSIVLPTNYIKIDGTATDADGTIASYSWSKVSGGNASLSGTTSSSLSVSNLVEGAYTFRLTIKDNKGATDTDDVNVTVSASTLRLIAPTVNAGANETVVLPTTSATLYGTASDDGNIVSYQWTKVSGGTCTMYNTTSAALKLAQLTSGSYTFRLTAKDNEGLTSSDDVTVIVDAKPVVNAGADITLTLPTSSVVLKGSAIDTDGTIVKYVWSKYSGPNYKPGTNYGTSFSVSGLYAGTYVFKLAVTDNLGVTGIDYVTVTVK
jgi:hypothetical protein